MKNNKQQTTVKLYTEAEIVRVLKIAFADEINPESFVKDLIHIELPTDEDIKKMMELDSMEFDEFDPYNVSYLGGATWMRNKIQGGEQ